jgi:hypothetical protein
MPTGRLFSLALIGWPIAVLLALAIRTVLVTPGLSSPEYIGWMFLGCAPVAIALIMLRSRPTESVAQVLYDAEHAGDAKPPKPTAASRG